MGLVIDSPALARRLATFFDVEVPTLAYEARPATSGACVEWIERTATGDIRHAVEPGSRASQRATVEFLSVLPID